MNGFAWPLEQSRKDIISIRINLRNVRGICQPSEDNRKSKVKAQVKVENEAKNRTNNLAEHYEVS